MYWLLLALLLALGTASLLYFARETDEAYAFGVFLGFVAIVFLLVGTFTTMYQISAQIEDVQNVRLCDEKAAILKEKSENLTKQFASYLAEVYPKHERDIFKTISPEKVSVYLAKYPDLKASDTIVKLVQEIGKLQDDYYQQRLLKSEVLKNLRYRPQNPWYVRSFIPQYAEK